MFREIVKEYRSEQTRVRIWLRCGKYVEGVIVNHGPEALLVELKPGLSVPVMKQAIDWMIPASAAREMHEERKDTWKRDNRSR